MTPVGKQPELGKTCDWCGLPAVGEVTVEREQWGKKDGRDVLKQAIVANACDQHLHITADQPPNMATFRLRKAKGVEQLDIFGSDHKPSSAIYGDAA